MSNIVQKLRTKNNRNFINDFDGFFRPISELLRNDNPDLDKSTVFLDDSIPLIYGNLIINLPISLTDDKKTIVYSYSSDRGVYKLFEFYSSQIEPRVIELKGIIFSHIVTENFEMNEPDDNNKIASCYVDGYLLGNYVEFDINDILYLNVPDNSIVIHLQDNNLNSLAGVLMDYTVTINGVDFNTNNGIIVVPNYVLNSNLSCVTLSSSPRTINGNIHGVPTIDPQVLSSSDYQTVLFYTVAPLK